MAETLRVLIETGARRSFASALDWPGWSRSGRTSDQALEVLLDRAPRYQVVVGLAGLPWPGGSRGSWSPVVVEALPGTATTDFGAPDAIAEEERPGLDEGRAARAADLVGAAWKVLDQVVLATPETLRKGPRGGGRDRDSMVAHVLAAEAAYARSLGLETRGHDPTDPAAVAGLRERIAAVIRSGQPVENPRRRLWPVAYGARRIAWHALDHAWEMEDRRD